MGFEPRPSSSVIRDANHYTTGAGYGVNLITDRQTDRQTYRQRDIQTDISTDNHSPWCSAVWLTMQTIPSDRDTLWKYTTHMPEHAR